VMGGGWLKKQLGSSAFWGICNYPIRATNPKTDWSLSFVAGQV